jgi:hypothetical protein
MATVQTEDASDRLHLSLLSSPQDHNNPNTGVYSYREAAQGQGTWIVIINTGYNWELFPEVSPKGSAAWLNPQLLRSPDKRESGPRMLLQEHKYYVLIQYFADRDCCTFECSSILLGSLLKAMVDQGLYSPRPTQPFHVYSVAELMKGVRKIKSPIWAKIGSNPRPKVAAAHPCSLNEFIEPIIQQVENPLRNMSLYDFGLKSMADSAYQQHIDQFSSNSLRTRAEFGFKAVGT